MNTAKLVAALTVAALAVGCTAQKSDPAPSAPPPAPSSSQPAPPDVGFSPDVSDAAVTACQSALDAETDGAITVTGTEFSEANNAVYMVVGDNRAPWRCLVGNAGDVRELMFIGDEGAL